MSTESNSSEQTLEFHGGCFCRAISYKVTGLPTRSAYCHCTICQRLTGCPFIHTMNFPASAFTWTTTPPDLVVFSLHEKPHQRRNRCGNCGVCVASNNTSKDRWSIWGSTLDREVDGHTIKGWEVLKPTAHIFYETRLVDVGDKLQKWQGDVGSSKRLD